jgi:hypothetical protein
MRKKLVNYKTFIKFKICILKNNLHSVTRVTIVRWHIIIEIT